MTLTIRRRNDDNTLGTGFPVFFIGKPQWKFWVPTYLLLDKLGPVPILGIPLKYLNDVFNETLRANFGPYGHTMGKIYSVLRISLMG